MITEAGRGDQFTTMLDVMVGITGDRGSESAESQQGIEAHRAQINAVRGMGADAAWEMVSELERLAWKYHTRVFQAGMLGMIGYLTDHDRRDWSDFTEGQRALLLTLPIKTDDFTTVPEKTYRRILTGMGVKQRGAVAPLDRGGPLDEEQAVAVSKLVTTVTAVGRKSSPLLGSTISPVDVVTVTGLPMWVELIVENPSAAEFPAEWAASLCAERIADAAKTRMSYPSERKLSAENHWLSAQGVAVWAAGLLSE
jgi:hypothetical protein